jgi:DNA polymerase III subunit delta
MKPAAEAAMAGAALGALVDAARAGRYRPIYLLIGEPAETGAAARAVCDALVPAAQRAFNLETYDGRATPLRAVLDSLRTPGFCRGVKVVWLRESPVFLAGARRTDVTAALLAAWRDGRTREAGEALLTLVALAGWSQEQFRDTQWAALAKGRVREVFGEELDAAQVAQVAEVHAACLARGAEVSAYQDESAALLALLDAGMPPHTVLLCTAVAADARKRLVKRLAEIGAVLDLGARRERSGALSRETVDDRIQAVLCAANVRLAPEAGEALARRAGTDLAVLTSELEKLCLYVGAGGTVSAADVRAAFRDLAESWIFDFTAALAARELERALPLLRALLSQGEPVLRLLAMIAREVRQLLLARECLDGGVREHWRGGMSFPAFQSRVLPQLDGATRQAFGGAHPFAVYRRFQDAGRLDAAVLRGALVRLSDLDRQLKSSRSDPRLLLEAFLIDWCRAGRAADTRAVRHGERR